MKYSVFLGCTIPARARHYEMAFRKVAEVLGLQLVDTTGYSCCGFPIKTVDYDSHFLMAARNIAIAEKLGNTLCTLCSACTSVLTEVNHEIAHHEKIKEETNKKLALINPEYKVSGNLKIRHQARLLFEDVGLEKIKSFVKKDLSHLRIAAHYGCHYLKPSSIYEGFDHPEDPKTLDMIVEALGAQPVGYEDKKWCCGGGLMAVDADVAMKMAHQKLVKIKEVKPDAITLVCPFCSVMYDDNQKGIEDMFHEEFGIPVIFLPQLMGLAFGIDPKDLGLNMNRVKTKDLIDKVAA